MLYKFEEIFKITEDGMIGFVRPLLVGGNHFGTETTIGGRMRVDGIEIKEQRDKMVKGEPDQFGRVVFQGFVSKNDQTEDFVEITGKKVTITGDNLKIKIEGHELLNN